MIREYLLFSLKILTTILILITLISVFFFTRNGIITRKGIIVSYVCFLLSTLSAWTLGLLYKPSLALTSVLCLGGFVVVFSLFWALKYYSLPFIEKKIDEITHKKD